MVAFSPSLQLAKLRVLVGKIRSHGSGGGHDGGSSNGDGTDISLSTSSIDVIEHGHRRHEEDYAGVNNYGEDDDNDDADEEECDTGDCNDDGNGYGYGNCDDRSPLLLHVHQSHGLMNRAEDIIISSSSSSSSINGSCKSKEHAMVKDEADFAGAETSEAEFSDADPISPSPSPSSSSYSSTPSLIASTASSSTYTTSSLPTSLDAHGSNPHGHVLITMGPGAGPGMALNSTPCCINDPSILGSHREQSQYLSSRWSACSTLCLHLLSRLHHYMTTYCSSVLLLCGITASLLLLPLLLPPLPPPPSELMLLPVAILLLLLCVAFSPRNSDHAMMSISASNQSNASTPTAGGGPGVAVAGGGSIGAFISSSTCAAGAISIVHSSPP